MDKCTRDSQVEYNRIRSRLDKNTLTVPDIVAYFDKLLLGDTPASNTMVFKRYPRLDEYTPLNDSWVVNFKPVIRETKMLNDMKDEMDDLLNVYTSGEEHLKYKERAALDSLTYCMKRYIEAQEERKTMSDKLRNFKEKLEAVENNDYDDEEEAEDDDD